MKIHQKYIKHQKDPEIKRYYAITITMPRQPGIKHFLKFWWGADVWVNGVPILKVMFALNLLAFWLLK